MKYKPGAEQPLVSFVKNQKNKEIGESEYEIRRV